MISTLTRCGKRNSRTCGLRRRMRPFGWCPSGNLNLEQAIEFIADDEFVEITPKSLRLRKKVLQSNKRKKRAMADGGRRVKARSRIRKIKDRRRAANVSGPLQLRNDVRGCGKLRPARDRLEPVFDLPELRQAARSQEPAAASGISSRGILAGRRVLADRSRVVLTCAI